MAMRQVTSIFFNELSAHAHHTLVLNTDAHSNLRKWLLTGVTESRALYNLLTGGRIENLQSTNILGGQSVSSQLNGGTLSLTMRSFAEIEIWKYLLPAVSERLTKLHIKIEPGRVPGWIECRFGSLRSITISDSYCEFEMASLLKCSQTTVEHVDLEGILLTPSRITDLVTHMPPKLRLFRLSYRHWLGNTGTYTLLAKLVSTTIAELCIRIPRASDNECCRLVIARIVRCASNLNTLELEHENVPFAMDAVRKVGKHLVHFKSNSPHAPLRKEQFQEIVSTHPHLTVYAHIICRGRTVFNRYPPAAGR